MINTVLVPVDFNVESLNTLRLALEQQGQARVRAVLMYARYQEDSITDLLFHTPTRVINRHLKPEFIEALSIIKNRHETALADIQIKLFQGQNINALKNFTEGNRVTSIVLPKSYRLKPNANGYDPIPLIRKSKMPFTEVDWEPSVNLTQAQQLNSLFK